MVTSGPKLLLRAMPGSVVLMQLGPVLTPMAHFTTGTIGTMCVKSDDHAKLVLPFAGPAPRWPLQKKNWSHPSWESFLNPHRKHERAGPDGKGVEELPLPLC